MLGDDATHYLVKGALCDLQAPVVRSRSVEWRERSIDVIREQPVHRRYCLVDGMHLIIAAYRPIPKVLKNQNAEVSHNPKRIENSIPPAIGSAQPGKPFVRTMNTLARNAP